MRYLNKIVLINSANISYAEISLDGNVHFTGTQGVGKSTVLRALLFFYNADKQHLGIQQGQKPFIEFYFKNPNSYIVYEVNREIGAYSILVSRYQGKVTYQFIDAPYSKAWLIDDGNHVFSDWQKIKERLHEFNLTASARIDTGSFYRDVIFGNTNDHKYTKFAIVESSRYQNIPRSIQNVFLNSIVDADFVKNTIIQSMDDDIPIDMTSYRSLISDFEREYEEIDCWFRKDKNGNYPVRDLANKIAQKGREVTAYDSQIREVWHYLNYVYAHYQELLPLLIKDLDDLNSEKSKEDGKRKDVNAEKEKEESVINRSIGGYKTQLDEIKKQKRHFEEKNIKDILALEAKEPQVKQSLEQIQHTCDSLLDTNRTIAEKYDLARQKLELDKQSFINSQNEALQKKRNDVQIRRDRIDKEYVALKEKASSDYFQWLEESDIRLATLTQERTACSIAVRELRDYHPKKEECDKVKEEIRSYKNQENLLVKDIAVKDNNIKQLRTEGEYREKEIISACDRIVEKLNERISLSTDKIKQLEDKLSNLSGTLYEWLSENMEGWESTIGKVVDENRVLYSQGLSPEKIADNGGLFGLQINLESITPSYRTPDEIRITLQNEKEDLSSLNNDLRLCLAKKEDDMEKLQKEYSSKINPLRQELSSLILHVEQIPNKIKDLETQLHKLFIEEEELVSEETKIRQERLDAAVLKESAENEARLQRKNRLEKDKKSLSTEQDKKIKELVKELTDFKNQLEIISKTKEEEFDKNLKDINAQEKKELANKGVDTDLIEQYRNKIQNLRETLNEIAKNHDLVVQYKYFEQEILSKEPTYQKEKKALEDKLVQLKQKYKDRLERIELKIESLKKRISEKLEEQKAINDGIKQYQDLVDKEHIVPQGLYNDSLKKETTKTCQDLIAMFRGSVNSKQQSLESLKMTVNNFNKNFKPQNAFNFNTIPQTDLDYLSIAIDIQEFLDNGKIEEFRVRTSNHYKDILQRISKEVGSLLKRRSDVDVVIKEINRDFIEKNFAGVIRSIELQSTDSSDKLMKLLISIYNYTYIEENYLSMGEMNLFSGDNVNDVNKKVLDYLRSLTSEFQNNPNKKEVTLGDTFRLQFRVRENDNDTGWVERINNVGSDGTDILVKAMVNIMLINVFKKRASKKKGDFIVHCMMDEIGRLHPNNIKGILQFANSRNIYLINSSPTSYNAYDYKYTYLLRKNNLKTQVNRLLKRTV